MLGKDMFLGIEMGIALGNAQLRSSGRDSNRTS